MRGVHVMNQSFLKSILSLLFSILCLDPIILYNEMITLSFGLLRKDCLFQVWSFASYFCDIPLSNIDIQLQTEVQSEYSLPSIDITRLSHSTFAAVNYRIFPRRNWFRRLKNKLILENLSDVFPLQQYPQLKTFGSSGLSSSIGPFRSRILGWRLLQDQNWNEKPRNVYQHEKVLCTWSSIPGFCELNLTSSHRLKCLLSKVC